MKCTLCGRDVSIDFAIYQDDKLYHEQCILSSLNWQEEKPPTVARLINGYTVRVLSPGQLHEQEIDLREEIELQRIRHPNGPQGKAFLPIVLRELYSEVQMTSSEDV